MATVNKRVRGAALCALAITALSVSRLALAQEIRTYFVPDTVGSPTIGTDVNANIVWTEDYLPYGARRVQAVNSGDNQRWFTAATQNEDTGLLYMHHRYYDPITGRFLSVDQAGVGFEDGSNFNRYWYARNNPYGYVDPDGRSIFSILDWKDFGVDAGRLTVTEIIWASATIRGDASVIALTIEDMEAQRFDAAASTAGIISPVPRTGRYVKTVARMVDSVDTAAKYAQKAARATGAFFKTTKEAAAAAEKIGFRKINQRVHGQAVFTDGKRFITRDVDGHQGGAWKAANSVEGLASKNTRSGTYSADMSARVGD